VRLTTDPAPDSDPTVADGWVVFVSRRDGNPELYRVPLLGGMPERLTDNAVVDADPTLSADGSQLAWVTDATGVPKLWTGGADAGGAARATAAFGRAGSVEVGPTWAGTGSELAFVSTTNGSTDLYVLNSADGSVVTALIDHSSPEVEPAWNPEQGELAFVSARSGTTNVFLLNLSNGDVTQLTDRVETDAEPTWVDKNRIVYTAWTAGETELRWLHVNSPHNYRVIPLFGVRPGNPAAVR